VTSEKLLASQQGHCSMELQCYLCT